MLDSYHISRCCYKQNTLYQRGFNKLHSLILPTQLGLDPLYIVHIIGASIIWATARLFLIFGWFPARRTSNPPTRLSFFSVRETISTPLPSIEPPLDRFLLSHSSHPHGGFV